MALTGLILAWRVQVGPGFLATSSLLWLVLLLGGALLAPFVLRPPR